MKMFLSVFWVFCLWVYPVFAQPVVKVSVLRGADQPFVEQHETDSLRESLIEIQSFFASEMNRLGYGAKTFEFEPHIPVRIGLKDMLEYSKDLDVVRWQYGRSLIRSPNDIHMVFLAGADSVRDGDGGAFTHRCDDSGQCNFRRLVVMPLFASGGYRNRIAAHELGHAFGFLEHINTGKNYLMEASLLIMPGEGHLSNFQLHPEVAKTLNASKDLSIIDGVNTDKFDRRTLTDHDESPQTENIDADVNKDGYVDLADVIIVRSSMQNPTSYDTDVNGDGKTNEIDVLLVKAKAMEALAAAAPTLYIRKKITTWGALKSRQSL